MQIKYFTLLFFTIALAGCQSTSVNTSYESNYSYFGKSDVADNLSRIEKSLSAQNNNTDDLWQLTRANLKFSADYNKNRVVKEINFYNNYPKHMSKVSKQASPYYHYVLQEVLKRGYPSEVALLPVVESLYNPAATSYGKAAGIWQFIPSTATYLGISINSWYDGRRDVITSTQTALDYLASLNKRFDGDWMLTFAAYNAGGGTVSNAIKRNKKQNKATDYWSLDLPKETMQYVPRLLAISALVQQPNKYNIALPSIANTPYFSVVKSGGQIDLNKVTQLANINKEILKKLNPGFKRRVTAPNGPHRILVPVEHAEKLELSLKSLNKKDRLDWDEYKVKSGDSLGLIAQRFGVSVKMIQSANSLNSYKIRIGKTLLIPMLGTETKSNTGQQLAKTKANHKTHKINNGDTVWDIAKKHKLSVQSILALNGLSSKSKLKVGTSIKIPRG